MTNPTKESLEIAKDIAKKVVPGFLLVPYGATKKGEPLLSGLIIKHTAQALDSYAKTQFERARDEAATLAILGHSYYEIDQVSDKLREEIEKKIKTLTYELPEDKR